MHLRKSQPYFILSALWLVILSISSQTIIISPILPYITAELHISASLQGTLISAYAFMVAVFSLIAGPISDSIGRRRILLIGSASMTITLLLHSVANNLITLFIVRAFAGASGGILSGAVVAYIGDYFTYEKRGWANGWVLSGQAAGQILGIPSGVLLAEAFGFRATFILFAATIGMACLLICFFVPQPDVRRDQETMTLHKFLKKYKSLLLNQRTRISLTIFFLMNFSLLLYVTYLPTWLNKSLGIGGAEIASLFFIGGLATFVTMPFAGHLSDRLGRKPLILYSSLGFSLIMLATPFVLVRVWVAYLLFFLGMIQIAMRTSPFQALLTELVDARQRGSLMSLNATIGQVGIGLGSALAGPPYALFGYESNAILAATIMAAVAILVWRFLSEPRGITFNHVEDAGSNT